MAAILDSLGFTFLIDRMTEVLTPDIYIELTGGELFKKCFWKKIFSESNNLPSPPPVNNFFDNFLGKKFFRTSMLQLLYSCSRFAYHHVITQITESHFVSNNFWLYHEK
jgi:G:T-mismatch repair DNA endonuclease (very short patch repair protein)